MDIVLKDSVSVNKDFQEQIAQLQIVQMHAIKEDHASMFLLIM